METPRRPRLLLDSGADVNARAEVDAAGVGGQTPIFHAVSQYHDWGLPVARVLVERGADLAVRALLPGHYERPDEFVECTPLGYALRFPGTESRTVEFLRAKRGAAVGRCGVLRRSERLWRKGASGMVHFRG